MTEKCEECEVVSNNLCIHDKKLWCEDCWHEYVYLLEEDHQDKNIEYCELEYY